MLVSAAYCLAKEMTAHKKGLDVISISSLSFLFFKPSSGSSQKSVGKRIDEGFVVVAGGVWQSQKLQSFHILFFVPNGQARSDG